MSYVIKNTLDHQVLCYRHMRIHSHFMIKINMQTNLFIMFKKTKFEQIRLWQIFKLKEQLVPT